MLITSKEKSSKFSSPYYLKYSRRSLSASNDASIKAKATQRQIKVTGIETNNIFWTVFRIGYWTLKMNIDIKLLYLIWLGQTSVTSSLPVT